MYVYICILKEKIYPHIEMQYKVQVGKVILMY